MALYSPSTWDCNTRSKLPYYLEHPDLSGNDLPGNDLPGTSAGYVESVGKLPSITDGSNTSLQHETATPQSSSALGLPNLSYSPISIPSGPIPSTPAEVGATSLLQSRPLRAAENVEQRKALRQLNTPFRCPYCRCRPFISQYMLEAHLTRTHGNKHSKKYQCNLGDCDGRAFSTLYTLKRHQNSTGKHRTKASPTYCCSCGSPAARKDHHYEHIRTCLDTKQVSRNTFRCVCGNTEQQLDLHSFHIDNNCLRENPYIE